VPAISHLGERLSNDDLIADGLKYRFEKFRDIWIADADLMSFCPVQLQVCFSLSVGSGGSRIPTYQPLEVSTCRACHQIYRSIIVRSLIDNFLYTLLLFVLLNT
jgi:hypothetical protein